MDTSTDLFEDSETEEKSSVFPQIPHTISSNIVKDKEQDQVLSLPTGCADPDLTDEEDIYNMPTQPVVIPSHTKRTFDSLFGSEADAKSPSSSQETVICETPAKKPKSPSSSQETVICETPAKIRKPEHGRTLLLMPLQVPCVSTPIKSNLTATDNNLTRTPMLALSNPSQAFGWDTPTQPNPDISCAAQFVIAESDNSGSDTECEDAYLLPTQPNLDIHSHNTQERLTSNNKNVGQTRLSNGLEDDSSSDTVLSAERDSPDLFNLPTQANPFNDNVTTVLNSRTETVSSRKEEPKPTGPWDLIPTQPTPQFHNKENTRLECDSGSETELEDDAMELTQPFNIHEIATQLNPMTSGDPHTCKLPSPRTSVECNSSDVGVENQPLNASPENLEFTLVYSESETESEAEQPSSSTNVSTKDQLLSCVESIVHKKSSTHIESDSDTEWEDDAETQPAKSPTLLFDQPTQLNPLIHGGAVGVDAKNKISDEDLPDTEPLRAPYVVSETLVRQEPAQDDLPSTELVARSPTRCNPSSVNLALNSLQRTGLDVTKSVDETSGNTVKPVTQPLKPTSQEELRVLSELETQVWVVSPPEDVTESSNQVSTVANQQSIVQETDVCSLQNSVQRRLGRNFAEVAADLDRNGLNSTRNVHEIPGKDKLEKCPSRRIVMETVSTEAATQIWDLPTQPNPYCVSELNRNNNINRRESDKARIITSNITPGKPKTPRKRPAAVLEPSSLKEKSASAEAETQLWELPTQPNPQFHPELNGKNRINSSNNDGEIRVHPSNKTPRKSKTSQRRSTAELETSDSEEETLSMEVETQVWDLPTQPNPQFLAKPNGKNKNNSSDSNAEVTSSKIPEENKTPQKRSRAMPSCPDEEIALIEAETQIWHLPTQPNSQFLSKPAGTTQNNSSERGANVFIYSKIPEKCKTPEKRSVAIVSHPENEIAPMEAETQLWELLTQPNPQFLARPNISNGIDSSDSDTDIGIGKSNETAKKNTPQKRSVAAPELSDSDEDTEEDFGASKPKTVGSPVANGGYLSKRSRNVIRRSEMHTAEKKMAENSSRVTGNVHRNSGADSPDVFSLSQLMLPDSEDLTPPSSDNAAKNIGKPDTEKRQVANSLDISDDDTMPLPSQNVPMYGFPREDALGTPAHTDLKLIQNALNQPNTPKRASLIIQNGILETDGVVKSPEAEAVHSALENNNGPTPPKKPRVSTRKGKRLQVSEGGVHSKIPPKRSLRVDSPDRHDQSEERQPEERKSRGRKKATAVESHLAPDASVSHSAVEETPSTSRGINLRRKNSVAAKAVARGSLASEGDTAADLENEKDEAPKRSRGRPRKVATQPKEAKTGNVLPPPDQVAVNEVVIPKSELQPGTSAGGSSTVLFSPKMTRGKKKSLLTVKEPKQIAKVTGMRIDNTDLKMTLAIEPRRTTRTKATESVQVNERVSPVAGSKRGKALKPVQIKQEPEELCEVTKSDEPRPRRVVRKRESIEVKEESKESTGALKWSFRERKNCAFRVLFTGIDEPDDKDLVSSLGGVVVERIEDCQVLVTDKVRRTVKFLCAVGAGKLIVSHLWLRECRIRGKFVDPEPFLLKDKQGEKKHNFQLELSVAKAKENPLLADWKFFLTPSILPPPPEMSEIITSSGGRVVSTFRSVNKEQAAVISVKDDENLWPTYTNLGIPILSTEAILTCVLRQSFETKPYLLRENKR